MVLRDLPAAVRLAGRLHHPAGRRLRPGGRGPGRRGPRATCPGCPRTPPAPVDRRLRPTAGPCWTGRAPSSGDAALPGRPARRLRVAPSAATCARPATWSSTSACCSCCSGSAVGGLFGFRGTSVVIVGQGFSNNLTQYDDFTAGRRVHRLRPGAVHRRGEGLRGEVRDRAGAARRGPAVPGRRRGDRPARRARRSRDAGGQPAAEHRRHHRAPDRPRLRAAASRSRTATATSPSPVRWCSCRRTATSPRPARSRCPTPGRSGWRSRAFFLPTAVLDASTARARSSPTRSTRRCSSTPGPARRRSRPASRRTSTPSTPTGLTQLQDANGQPVRLRPAARRRGRPARRQGTIQLDGWTRWVKLQIGDTPGVPISIGAIGFAVAGLCLSLFIRPRRVWVAGARCGAMDLGWWRSAGWTAPTRGPGWTEDVAELAGSSGLSRHDSPARKRARRELRVLLQPGAGHLGRGLHCWPCSPTPRSGPRPAAARPCRRAPNSSPPGPRAWRRRRAADDRLTDSRRAAAPRRDRRRPGRRASGSSSSAGSASR